MAESIIKIKATVNEMNKQFKDCPSHYYYIKYFNGEKNYKGKDDEPIVFEVRIRHNEIGGKNIERTHPYTFETLEKTLSKKVREFEQEQKINKEIDESNNLQKATEIDELYDIDY